MITLSLDIGGTRMKLALLEDGKILLERMVEAYRDDKYQKNLDTAEREGKAMMAELGIARIDGTAGTIRTWTSYIAVTRPQAQLRGRKPRERGQAR